MAKHRKLTESEKAYVHLEAPETLENKGVNLYCPVEQELTAFYLGYSADRMEVYVCGACREPEPMLQTVTQEDLYTIAEQLDNDQ